MVREGVDYSSGYPTVAGMRAAGKDFVIRYARKTGTLPKNITRAEADQWKAAGIDIAIVDEVSASRALDGYAAGQADANAAADAVKSIGGPADSVIYLAVDFAATPTQIAGPVKQYLAGGVAALGYPRIGVYGSYDVVRYMLDNRVCKYAWQTYAWSGGVVDPRAHLYQYRNAAATIDGVQVDFNRAYTADFGQWGVQEVDDMPYTEQQLRDIFISAACATFRLPAPGNTNGWQPGMAVPAGQLHNGNFFAMVSAALGTAATNTTAIKNAVAAVQTAVGAQADDEKVILATIAALPPPTGLTDEQVAALGRELAEQLPGGATPQEFVDALRTSLVERLTAGEETA